MSHALPLNALRHIEGAVRGLHVRGERVTMEQGLRRRAHMMVQALLPGCSTMQLATNQRDAWRSKAPPVTVPLNRQYVAPARHSQLLRPAGIPSWQFDL